MKESAVQHFQFVPVSALVESPTNPRRITSKKADVELGASVKELGVLEPLLARVRPGCDLGFEVIAGHRRLAAAKAAGFHEVPVRILELNDDQALEAAIVENLQRQDVHPLDEADGFARLLETHKHDVKGIAARVGKSEAYVYQRLALRRLSKKARELFVKETITAAHALQLVKLTADQQDQALKWGAMREDDVATVRDLAYYIRQEFFTELSAVPWKLDDATLLPAAGACSTCPKRAGAQPGLFADEKVKGETCLDSKCFKAKFEAHLAGVKKELAVAGDKVLEITADSWTPDKKVLSVHQYVLVPKHSPCASTKPAVMVDGKQRGQAFTVCTDPKCKDHGKKIGDRYGRPSGSEDNSWKKKAAAEEKKRKTEKACRRATAERIRGKLAGKPLPNAVRHVVVSALFGRLATEDQKKVLEAYGIEIAANTYGPRMDALQKKAVAGFGAEQLELFLVRCACAIGFWGYGELDAVKQLAAAAGVKAVTAKELAQTNALVKRVSHPPTPKATKKKTTKRAA